MPLPDVQYRLNNLSTLDSMHENLHACPLDLQRLLLQLQGEGPCPLRRLLMAWPSEMHDVLSLSVTWLAKLGCINWSSPRSLNDTV